MGTHSNGNKVKLTTPDTLSTSNNLSQVQVPTGSLQFLQTDGSGALSFATPNVILFQHFLTHLCLWIVNILQVVLLYWNVNNSTTNDESSGVTITRGGSAYFTSDKLPSVYIMFKVC